MKTHNSPPYPGAPRWVKVFGIIALVLALLIVIGFLIGDGLHGPRRHTSVEATLVATFRPMATMSTERP